MITTLSLALVLSAVFAGSGAVFALTCAPDLARPLARFAQPAMAASMLVIARPRRSAPVSRTAR